MGLGRDRTRDPGIAVRHASVARHGTDCPTRPGVSLSKGTKIMNRYNQVPHLTQDTNGKVTNSQLDTTNESQEVSLFPAADHKAHTVKPAVAVTSIKRDPPLNGHFRVPPNDFECKCTSIQRAPVQRGQRSAKFAPKR